MNGMVKLLYGIVIVIVMVGLVGCKGTKANTRAQDVEAAAARIADFTLPDGYKADYTVTLAGFTVAAYNPGDGHSHLMLAQGPADFKLDQAKVDEITNQSQPGRTDRTTRLTVIEQRNVTVRGQATTLVISEGTNSEGLAYRQLSVPFQGKGGPALLVLNEPVTRWDTARIDKLLASIQ